MTIWFDGSFPIDYANERGQAVLAGQLGMELLEAGEDYLLARMPVDERTMNPAEVLHGGASVAFAETIASWAGSFVVDPSKKQCVGLEINANHVRPVPKGQWVYARATPEAIGKKTQVWSVRICNAEDKLVCVSRMTLAVLDIPSKY